MQLLQHATRLAGRFSARTKATVALATIGVLLPTAAFASEGDSVSLQFSGTDMLLLAVTLGLGIFAIIVAFGLARWVLAQSPGDNSMTEVGGAIKAGAIAYLKQQVATMVGFVVLLAVGLFGLNYSSGTGIAIGVAVAFIFGVIGSYVAGATGMIIAVNGNMRTANAALTSYKRSLEVAFRSGAVAGLLTVGIGIVGAALILMVGGAQATKYLIGFGFGGSLAALFMRVGGGIFTKAADVGADLVGKVEAGIPEDDPRNPAVIADNVGDNVGDCAGMAADVFESYEVTLVSAIVLAAATGSVVDHATWTKLVLFALIVSGVGILASVIGIFTVKGSDSLDSDPLAAIRGGFQRTAIIAGLLIAGASFVLMGGSHSLTTSRLVSTQADQLKLAQFVQDIRNDLKKVKADPAAVQKAQAEYATANKKMVADVTSNDLYSQPDKVPAPLFGTPRAAVDRYFSKNTQPINDAEITVYDILNTQKAKDAGYTVNDLDLLLVGSNAQVDTPVTSPDYSGYVAVDPKTSTLKALDYAMPEPMDAMPQGLPQTQKFKSIRDTFSGTGDDAFMAIHLKVHTVRPAVPAANGQPAQPEVTRDSELWQGPIVKSALLKQIDDAKKQVKAQGGTLDVTLDKEVPVTLYAKSDNDPLVLGVAGVDRPVRLQGQRKLQYYRKTVAEMSAPQMTPSVPVSMDLANLDQKPIPWWGFMLATWVGLALAFVIEHLTEYYVSTHKKPTQEVAGVSSGGAATMIIQGFAYAAESSAMMVLAIVAAIMAPLFIFPAATYGGYVLALYGVALVGLGLLSTTGYVLAMDTFGPISDNAQGVFEMSGAGHNSPSGAKAVGHLDAAGNTTKALTKGFAIATAVVAAIALFNSYRGSAMLTELGLKLDTPEVFLGLLIGGAAPFLFSAFAINAVGRSAFQLINEVRRQFRENPGIMRNEVKPDYARCVAIVTAAAQKELLAPGILAIALPAAVAFGFSIGKPTTEIGGHSYNLTGAMALGGFLAGAILSGQLMAVLLSNAGGMWDNAKKLIEDGLYGGKGSEAHKASVVCDTVGDPFKDTAGPALNPLIKVMNLVALLLAPTIIQPMSSGLLAVVTLISVGLLGFSFYLSKKGSFSDDLRRAQSEGATADAHFSSPSLDTPAEDLPKKRRITVDDED